MSALYAGIPNTTAVNTVNRQCSSGLTAVNQIAMEILTGEIDIGIGEYTSLFSPSLASEQRKCFISFETSEKMEICA